MANTKISNLTELTTPIGGDLFPIVDDPTVTPITKYIKGHRLVEMGERNYTIVVTVVANDLVVALKDLSGNNFSATNPLVVKIGNVWRTVTAALSITIPDGTNYFDAGGVKFGGLLTGHFTYLVWDSNSSIVALTISRIPWARLVSDFSATTTNIKHAFNYANFTTTDDVVNIGYFEATLSLTGTSHVWTVPTFTGANLRNQPTYESRILTYTTAVSALSGTITTVGATTCTYLLRMQQMFLRGDVTITTNGTGAGALIATHPFTIPDQILLANEYTTSFFCYGLTQSGNIYLRKSADGTYPGADGRQIKWSGWVDIT